MSYLNFKSEYDRFPKTTIKNHKAFCGYDEIYHELNKRIKNSSVVVFDYYPGVDEDEVYDLIKRFSFSLEINMHDIFKDGKTMTEQMKYSLTDDRVFGKMYYGNLVDFMDEEKLEEAKNKIREHKESVIIYGVGAGLVTQGDVYVYFDMARWEIQLRYRKSMPNYNCDNFDEDILKKCIDNRKDCENFVFYDGPATANGMPGLHHMMAKFLKDTFCKYKTMQGYRVLRKVGWDTHGLPVE